MGRCQWPDALFGAKGRGRQGQGGRNEDCTRSGIDASNRRAAILAGPQERQFRQRQAERSAQPPPAPADTQPKSLSGGRIEETDAAKCNYARDILSGALLHRNGAPTDENDRRIAENDSRTYCH